MIRESGSFRARFRDLVKEWHPDRNKGKFTEKRMSEINKAYEILSDEETRKNYDDYTNKKKY